MYGGVRDEDIYRYLLGEGVVVGDMYRSPIPWRTDNAPSFGLFEKEGIIKWKDYGIMDPGGNRSVNLVMQMKDLSFHQAIKYIETEIRGNVLRVGETKLKKRKGVKGQIPFVRWREEYRPYELKYWAERYRIGENRLKHERVFPLDVMSYIGPNSKRAIRSTPEDPAFIYLLQIATRQKPFSFKVYRPLANPKNKFRQWNVSNVIEGWISLAEEWDGKPVRYLLNLSSTKDRMVVKKCGYQGFNGPGEGYREVWKKAAPVIAKISPLVISILDADNAGYNASVKLYEEQGWPFVDMRGKLGTWVDKDGTTRMTKDVSDFIDPYKGGHSYQELAELLDEELEQILIKHQT